MALLIKPVYQMVPIEKIVAIEEFNTRTGGIGDISDLVASVKAVGIIEPLLGKDKENGNDEIEIYAGFRRFAAAQAAELTEVPIIVTPRRRVTRKQMLLGNITENVHRAELNPMDEALALERLNQEHSMTIEDIALELGIKKARVKARFKLLKLSPALKDSILEERITLNAAFDIGRLPEEHQNKYIKIAEDLKGKKLSTLIDRQLDKISKQATIPSLEKEEAPESPTVEITENVRVIKQCSTVITKALKYSEQDVGDVKGINYRVLDPGHLKTVSKLFTGMADLVPEEIDINEKASLEIAAKVEGESTLLDLDSPVVRQSLIKAICDRSKEIAVEASAGTGKRPKVTYLVAQQALSEFFKS